MINTFTDFFYQGQRKWNRAQRVRRRHPRRKNCEGLLNCQYWVTKQNGKYPTSIRVFRISHASNPPGKKQLAIFLKRFFFIDIISSTKPELSLFVVVVVVCFFCRLFSRLPIGEIMGLILFKLCQLELLIFYKDLPSFLSKTETWGNPVRWTAWFGSGPEAE